MFMDAIGYLLGAGARPLPVGKGTVITLGRDAQNTIPVDDATASRNHACIDCQGDAVIVKDAGSRNGTFVNGRRLASDESFSLRSGDEVRIGGKVFHFISNAAGLEPRKAAASRAQQFSQMQTLGWDSGLYAEDGKVVIKGLATQPVAPLPADNLGQTVASDAAATAALAGSLSEGSLPQILQFINSGAMSGRLQVSGKRVRGSILFLNGQLYSATTFDENGTAAVYACVLEREGRFSFDRVDDTQVQKLTRNITENTMQVVFECCRRMDEVVRAQN
jgi:pSer/pThr/pTyr-binding forkhead associated (FHA) protein